MANNKRNAFQAKVLTHLEYIRAKQKEHDEKLERIQAWMRDELKQHACRIENIEKDVASAKTIAKVFGGGGGFAGLISLLSKIFGWR